MKKLLMAGFVLCFFALSVCLVQISCSKSNAQQNRPTDNPQLNKLVFVKGCCGSPITFWTSNYDGTNQTQIPLVLSANIEIDIFASNFSITASPDGQTIFFPAIEISGATRLPCIYSCGIDGGNLRKVIESNSGLTPHSAVAI